MKKKKPLLKAYENVIDRWPYVISLLFLLGVLGAVLLFQLGTLVPGLSGQEKDVAARFFSGSISIRDDIVLQPVHYIFFSGLYIINLITTSDSIAYFRLTAVIIGAISALSLFYVLQKWHTYRIALVTTVLFITSAGFLHAARHADVNTSFLLLPVALALFIYTTTTKRMWAQIIAITALALILLSIPGGFVLLAILAIWKRKAWMKQLKQTSQFQQMSVIIIVALIASIFTASLLVSEQSNIYKVLGIGTPFVSLSEFIVKAFSVPYHLFIRGPSEGYLWVGVAPLLDVFISAMVLLGIYVFILQRKEDHIRLIVGTLFILILLSGFGAGIDSVYFLPFFYIISASGIALLLQQWFTVFPRNPFAKIVGIIFVSLCIGATALYNVHRYFVAWPHTTEARREFIHQPEDSVTIQVE